MLKLCRQLVIPILLALCGYSNYLFAGTWPTSLNGQPLPSLSPMLEKVTPSVVNIVTEGKHKIDKNLLNDPFFKRFFNNLGTEREIAGTGSGVIIHAKLGHILTNHHVLEGAERIMVTLNDGRRYQASIVGLDPKADLAIISIPAENLTAVRFGNSEQLRVGDFVVAIGNPYGIGQSVTSGIISALHRNPGIGEHEDFIQTDASINLGNSGGALLNLRGELIGINTAILGGNSGGNIGIGFAIPINTAAGIIDQIVKGQPSNFTPQNRGKLGVYVNDLDSRTASDAGLATNQGALVERIVPGSPAEKAGLEAGDIITQINNSFIGNAEDLKNSLASLRAGSLIGVIYIRSGNRRTVRAYLQDDQPPSGQPFWENIDPEKIPQ